MPGVVAGLDWSSYASSSTLRPSRPPLALTSSTHICSASSAALPPPPRVPVCAMPMPILTGADCASAAALNANPNMNDTNLMTSSLCGYCSQSTPWQALTHVQHILDVLAEAVSGEPAAELDLMPAFFQRLDEHPVAGAGREPALR